MVKNDASTLKKQRLQEISKTLASGLAKDQSLILNKILMYIQFNVGLTKSKALEYVTLCCDIHGWVIIDGTIQKGNSL